MQEANVLRKRRSRFERYRRNKSDGNSCYTSTKIGYAPRMNGTNVMSKKDGKDVTKRRILKLENPERVTNSGTKYENSTKDKSTLLNIAFQSFINFRSFIYLFSLFQRSKFLFYFIFYLVSMILMYNARYTLISLYLCTLVCS